jgi:CheY-like chemotaxis protein
MSARDPQGPEARRILVVEDNAHYRQFLASLLKRAGHVVLEAKSGREGLEFSEKWQPHLVVADIMLPDVDGLTMATRIKADPKTARIQIMLLSTFKAAGYAEQARGIGAAYLSKPIETEAFLESARRMLQG